MDLSFGQEYDDFRGEVVNFLANNADKLLWVETFADSKRRTGKNFSSKAIPAELFEGIGEDAEPDIIKTRIIAEEFCCAVNTGLGGQGISMLVPPCWKWVHKNKTLH